MLPRALQLALQNLFNHKKFVTEFLARGGMNLLVDVCKQVGGRLCLVLSPVPVPVWRLYPSFSFQDRLCLDLFTFVAVAREPNKAASAPIYRFYLASQ